MRQSGLLSKNQKEDHDARADRRGPADAKNAPHRQGVPILIIDGRTSWHHSNSAAHSSSRADVPSCTANFGPLWNTALPKTPSFRSAYSVTPKFGRPFSSSKYGWRV